MLRPAQPNHRAEIVWPLVTAALALIGIGYIFTSEGARAVGAMVDHAALLALLAIGQAALLRIRRLEPGLLGVAVLAGSLTAVLANKGTPLSLAAGIAIVVSVPPFAFISGRLALTRSPLETAAISFVVAFFLLVVSGVIIGTSVNGILLPRSGAADLLQGTTFGIRNHSIAASVIILLLGSQVVSLARRAAAGDSMERQKLLLLYLGASLLSACGGITLALWTHGAFPWFTSVDGFEIEILAAMLIGGVSLYGDRGGLWSAISGSLFVAALIMSLRIQEIEPTLIPATLCLVASIGFYIDYRRRSRKASADPYTVQPARS